MNVNIAEARLRLSEYLKKVQNGETIIICRRNVPIAQLRPIRQSRAEKRPVGIDRGMRIPGSFFEPLPCSLIEAFESRTESK